MHPTTNLFLASLIAVAACGSGTLTPDDFSSGSDDALLVKGAGDVSDASCNVVLRAISRTPDSTGGYVTSCTTAGGCWWVLQGEMDLSAAAVKEAKWVGVQYHSSVDNYAAWRTAKATKTTGAPAGMTRYQFKMNSYTVDPSASGTSLSQSRVEVAAYFKSGKGGRMFDHNRVPGALDNYVLDVRNGWAVRDDGATCMPPPMVSTRAAVGFLPGWTTEQHGALVAGGVLSVQYDPSRLASCRSTHNGYPGWAIDGTVRFSPGGESFALGQLQFGGPNGQPTLTGTWIPFDVKIPVAATAAEIWFENTDVNNCVAWDSNGGANYVFEVLAKAPASPLWAGNWGNGFNRECVHADGLAEPMVLTEWIRERACMWIDAEVYVPGLTDGGGEHPERLTAQVEYTADNGTLQTAWLAYAGRVGNNYRFRWDLPRDTMSRVAWSTYGLAFRFSTDGAGGFRIANADGPTGGTPRTLTRDVSWCRPGWPGCP